MSCVTRFATIDRYSGLVSWVGDAPTPEVACTLAEGADNGSWRLWNGVVPRRFERVPPDGENDGLAVYAVPEGFDAGDGRDRDVIAAVSRFPFVGVCRAVTPRDLADSGE